MKNLFTNSRTRWLRMVICTISLLVGTTQLWADTQFDEVAIVYSLDGGTTTHNYTCNWSYGDFTNYAVVTSSLVIKEVYYKYRRYNGNVCDAQLFWYNGSDHYDGCNTWYHHDNCWSYGEEGNVGYQLENNAFNVTLARSTDPSGDYTIYYYWQMWGSLATSDGCSHNWYMPNKDSKQALHYKIAPPAVSDFTITPSGVLSGSGTSADPYIVPYGGTVSFALSNASQAHPDANSSAQYSVDGGGSWGTTSSYTSKSLSNVTASSNQTYVFKAKYYNSTASLSGEVKSKTIYYKAAQWSVRANWETLDADDWNTDHYIANLGRNASSKDTGYVEITLPANTTFEFSMYDKGSSTWYKNGGDKVYYMEYASHNKQYWQFATDKTYNCGIITAGAGTYKFAFNITDKKVAVTFPTSYTVTFGYGTGGSTVTASGSGSGSITSGKYVASGENVTFTQTNATGYTFKGWYTTSDGNTAVPTMGVSDNILNSISANKTVYAQYTEDEYNVTAVASPTGAGTVTPSSATSYGQITGGAITATDGTGYDFSKWVVASGSGTIGSATTASTTFKPTATSTVKAIFCPESASGRSVYKFVVKSDVSNGDVCSTSGYETQSVGTQLSDLVGGTLEAKCASSQGQLAFSGGAYSFNGGDNGELKITLDCAIQTGDVVRYVNSAASTNAVYFCHTSKGNSTDRQSLNGNGKDEVQTIVLPKGFNGKSVIYLSRGSSATTALKSLEILRPYKVKLDAGTNSGTVNSVSVDSMFFAYNESQVLPHAWKSSSYFNGWFPNASTGVAVSNPYTATASTTLYAQFGDCPTSGTVYKFQVKSGLPNGALGITGDFDINVGNYLTSLEGGTLTGYDSDGSKVEISSTNAFLFKDSKKGRLMVDLDCAIQAGDTIIYSTDGSSGGYMILATTAEGDSVQRLQTQGTKVKIIAKAGLVGASTLYIRRNNSTEIKISYFEIKRPAHYTITHDLSHVTTSSPEEVIHNTDYEAVYVADDGYDLPASVTVMRGATNITTNCTWVQGTGTLTIPAAQVTGDITISITGDELSCSATAPGSISKGSASGGTGTITLTAAGSAATNNTWYWQSAADGTATNLGSGATKDVSATGTYYLRSYCSDNGGCWSDAVSVIVAAADLLTTPTATFSNGAYTIGSSALDLSSLWSSDSEGSVTYTVQNANGTGATISTAAFTATTAGTATVRASQAADGYYSAIYKDATITVSNPTYSVTYKANNSTAESDVVRGTESTFASNSTTSFTAPSTKAFAGWNTKADGSGTHYDVGDAVPSAITVYAEWRYKVYYLYEGGSEESNDITSALETNYVVSKHTTTGTSYNASDYSDYALIVLSETLTGSSAGTSGHEYKLIVGLNKPILNLKSYFYNSGRWGWGTPNAGKKPKNVYVKNGTYANLTSHPIYTDLTPDGNDSISVLSSVSGSKPIQPVGSFESGCEGYTLALVPNNSSGNGTAIHELTAAQRSAITSQTITSKYLMISIQSAELSNLSSDGETLIKNAADYLITGSQWVPQYTITYDKGSADGASGDSFTGTKTHGTSFSLSSSTSAFTRSGYTYDGWSTSADGSTKDYNLGGSYTTNAEITLYPHWVSSGYAITTGDHDGGTIAITDDEDNEITSAEEDDEVYLTATPNTGYEFRGWTVLDESDERVSVTQSWKPSAHFTMPGEAVTVSAEFAQVNYAIMPRSIMHFRYTVQVGEAEAVDGYARAHYGDVITLAQSSIADGYHLKTWGVTKTESGDPIEVVENQFTMPAEDVTVNPIVGKWYTVSFDANTGNDEDNPDPITQTSVDGAITMPEAPTKSGYTFVNWMIGGTTVAAEGSYTPPTDVTAYATWKETCAGGGGSTTVFSLTGITGVGSNLVTSAKDVGAYYDASSLCTLNSASDGVYVCACSSSGSLSGKNLSYEDSYDAWSFGENKIYLALYSATGFKAGDVITMVEGTNNTNSPHFAKATSSTLSELNNTDYYATKATNELTMSSTTAPASGNTYTYTGTIPAGFTSSNWLIVFRDGSTFKLKSITVTRSGGSCKYVTYKGNGAAGGHTDDATAYASSATVTVLSNSFSHPGYTFTGWNTKADGSGSSFAAASTFSITKDTTLYAQWSPATLYFTRAVDDDWTDPLNWKVSGGDPGCIPTIEHDVVIQGKVTLYGPYAEDRKGHGVAKSVRIEFGKNVEIWTEGGLIVAEDIKAKHAVDGEYEATTPDDLSIKTTILGNGTLITGEENSTTQALYKFRTKAFTCYVNQDGKRRKYYYNQYCGIPFQPIDPMTSYYGCTIYEYGAETDSWITPTTEYLQPFVAYNLLRKNAEDGDDIWLRGTLNLPGIDGEKLLECGWRDDDTETTIDANKTYQDFMFANSWTAPIDISSLDEEDCSDNLVQSIYMFNTGYEREKGVKEIGNKDGQWSVFPFKAGKYMKDAVIPGTQAFLVTAKSSGATLTLKYGKHVYTPALEAGGANNFPTRAPKRAKREEIAPNKLLITVLSDNTILDNMYIFEREDFTEEFDNGWDGTKIIGSTRAPQLYTRQGNNKMEVAAVPEMEGLEIGFIAGTDTNSYAFEFEYLESEPLYLYDRETMEYTPIENKGTYSFSTEDNEDHARFVLTRSKAPMTATGIESVKKESTSNKVSKVLINDHIYIIRGGKTYSVDGALVK